MAVTQLEFGMALLLGIGPALALLYLSLRRFDRPFTDYTLFDDRRVFFGLAAGMVFGVFAALLEASIGGMDFLTSLVIFFGALLFEEMFKLVYLNRRGYQGRFDTTFYGVSLGVGAASTAVVGTVVWGNAPLLYNPEGLGLLILFSLNLSFIHADTGALIGFGASRKDMWLAFEKAVGIRYVHFLLLIWFLTQAPEPWSLIASLTGLTFAVIVYHYVYTQLLPGTLPEDIRREMRRERRARTAKD
ncbi:MAG TPA: hypothetical protein VIB49_04760 [Thermoplasmata archaeon]|jgi:hypothetical protein